MSRRKRQQPVRVDSGLADGRSRPPLSLALRPPFGLLAGYSLLLAVTTIVLYFPILHHPFVNYDDGTYIVENPSIQAGLNFATLKWAFTSFYASNWHPLTWLVHAANFQFFGLDASGHHLTSLLFHAANTVLLFLLAAMATGAIGRSFFVAALFAFHPLNVESVAWAAELKNLLCTSFFLLAIAAYGWYARKPGISRYVLVFAAFVLALAAKPMAITLPFALLLLDFWPLSRVRSLSDPSPILAVPQWSAVHPVLEKLPLFALSAASAWVTILAQTSGQAATMIHPSLPLRVANALVAYATYMEKTLFPTDLALLYPFPVHGIPLWKILLSVVTLLAIFVLVARFGRQQRYLVTGWLWFLGTLVPVIGLFQVGEQSRADRYAYVPIMGLLFMLVWGAFEIANARRWTAAQQSVLGILSAVILFAVTTRQIPYWSSSYSLWTRSIAVTNDNAMAEHNLSNYLIHTGRIDEVYPHLLRAVQLNPDDMASHINLGNVYSSHGNHQEALREFETVIEKSKDPKFVVPATANAGSCYLKLGDLANAEEAYRMALRISPNYPAALKGLSAVERARQSSQQTAN